jgi:hypothetical protein
MSADWTFNPEVKEVLDSFLLDNPEVEPGKAFGMPAYYINGKVFAGVFGDGATLKVPEDVAADLREREGISEFSPMAGRVMRSWVLITRENPEDLVEERELFDLALEHVRELSLAPRKAKKKGK